MTDAEGGLTQAVRGVLNDLCRPRGERGETHLLTLGQLAERTGIDRTQLSRIRSGERGATVEHARALAGALHRWSQAHSDARDTLNEAIRREGGPDE